MALAILPIPNGVSLLDPGSGVSVTNPLHSHILATVSLCCAITTIFTIARLTVKRIVSKFNAEDCERHSQFLMVSISKRTCRYLDFSMGGCLYEALADVENVLKVIK